MSLTKDIKRALDALALAHAADYLSQQEKETVLGIIPADSTHLDSSLSAPAETPLRQLLQVALVADAGLPEHLVDYALDTCRHFKSGLIIVDTQPHQAGRLATQLQEIKSANIVLALHMPIAESPAPLWKVASSPTHQVRRTLRISCEAVPPSNQPAGAQGGTSACSTGAALSFVSCIRLFGGAAAPLRSRKWPTSNAIPFAVPPTA